jgi:hypothetical protein
MNNDEFDKKTRITVSKNVITFNLAAFPSVFSNQMIAMSQQAVLSLPSKTQFSFFL